MDFRIVGVSCFFHGQVLAVGHVRLAGTPAAKAPGSNMCGFNRLSGRSEKVHFGADSSDEDLVVYVVLITQLVGQAISVFFITV